MNDIQSTADHEQKAATSVGRHRTGSVRIGRRTRWRIGVGAVIVCAVTGGIGWYASHSGNRKANAIQTAAADSSSRIAVNVSVVQPHQGGLARYSRMAGAVHAYEAADLYAKVAGFLKSQEVQRDGKAVPVDIGLRVKKGELLAEIEDPEIHAEAEKAAADVEQARSQARQAEASLKTAKAELEATKAAVQEAQADVGRYASHREETRKAYARYKGLGGLNAVEQDVVDQRLDAYESAQAAEEAAKAAVITAQAKVSASEAKVDQAQADLEAARASIRVSEAVLKKAQAMAEYTRIRSPYDGVITLRSFHVGDFIRSATEGETKPMLSVARTDLMRIVTQISDMDVPYAEVGDPVVVTIDALPGLELHGTVTRFSEVEDPVQKVMRTEIDLPNDASSPAHGRMRAGMYGLATITLRPPSKHLSIPSACVVERQGKGDEGKVLVVRDGRAREVPIRTGADDGVHIEVVSGLAPSDQVIIPTGAVADGTPVSPSLSNDAEPKDETTAL